MEALTRLELLSADMDLEPAEDTHASPRSVGEACGGSPGKAPFLSQAVLPNGKQITLLKSLLTSVCERNCYYCPFRAGRDFRRATYRPDEMAQVYMNLHRAGLAQGIFLSSGIAGGSIRTQDKLIATADILRHRYEYQGYLHLKLMPGAEKDQIVEAMRLADRVSVNLEAPNTQRLVRLAPHKEFLDELLQPLRVAAEIRRTQTPRNTWNGYWPSMTTQFVVGAAGENDMELLATTAYLYQHLQLKRTYFSAFRPIRGTPLEDLPAEAPLREHRLYQASFLLRDYGFGLEDLPFNEAGDLPRQIDPKTAWAEANLQAAPIELNQANRRELLRIPGIGPKGAEAIIKARRQGKIHGIEDLRKIGINPNRATPFILLDGKRPNYQIQLW